ncbi:MAG: PTS sugar transporter subunit IIB [Lactobacillus sp.]|jgi:D-glucosaminate-specific PTS system IIB component|nr:PTS sugar transporter subunit IIB [Lactobacillus sp.]MCI2032336.1 PTS sugar transporter subunit IIB [Lactobacillus sp.]
MGKVVFSRIDFRLIHGQVVTKWIKQYPANTIAIINDTLAENDFLAEIYEMAAPSDVEVVILKEDEAKAKLDAIKGDVFVLFKDVATAAAAADAGVAFEKLVVGGVPKVDDKKMVTKAVYLDATDVEQLKAIAAHGIEVTCQAIPEDKPLKLADLVKEFS